MAKLSTYTSDLLTSISPLTDTSTGTGSAGIVSSALEVNTGTGDVGACGLGGFVADIDESEGYIEITALPTGGRCDLAWVDASENGYRLRLTSTQFTWARLAGGTPTDLSGPTTWLAASHKWIRIREASGTTYLEMAPDSGSTSPGSWTTFASEATTTSGWTHTAIDWTWFAPGGAGNGLSRYRYLSSAFEHDDEAKSDRRGLARGFSRGLQ